MFSLYPHNGRERGRALVSHSKDTNSIYEAPSSWSNYIPQVSSLNDEGSPSSPWMNSEGHKHSVHRNSSLRNPVKYVSCQPSTIQKSVDPLLLLTTEVIHEYWLFIDCLSFPMGESTVRRCIWQNSDPLCALIWGKGVFIQEECSILFSIPLLSSFSSSNVISIFFLWSYQGL